MTVSGPSVASAASSEKTRTYSNLIRARDLKSARFARFARFPPILPVLHASRPGFHLDYSSSASPPPPGALNSHFWEIASTRPWFDPILTVPHASTFHRVLTVLHALLPTAGGICTFLRGKCNSTLENPENRAESGLGTRGFGRLPEIAKIPAPHGGARDLERSACLDPRKADSGRGEDFGSAEPKSGTF